MEMGSLFKIMLLRHITTELLSLEVGTSDSHHRLRALPVGVHPHRRVTVFLSDILPSSSTSFRSPILLSKRAKRKKPGNST